MTEQKQLPAKSTAKLQASPLTGPEGFAWCRLAVALYMLGAGAYCSWYTVINFFAWNLTSSCMYLAINLVIFYIGITYTVLFSLQLAFVRLIKRGRYRDVERLAARSLSLLRGSPLITGTNLTELELQLGAALLQRGEAEHAYVILQRASSNMQVAIKSQTLPAVYANTVSLALARASVHSGHVDEAETLTRAVLASESDAFNRAISFVNLAQIECRRSNPDAILANIQSAKAVLNTQHTQRVPQIMYEALTFSMEFLSSVAHALQGDIEKSLVHHRKVFELTSPTNGAIDAELHCRLAETYLDNAKITEAEQVIRMAYNRLKLNSQSPEAQQTLGCFEKVLRAGGREQEIADMRAWLS